MLPPHVPSYKSSPRLSQDFHPLLPSGGDRINGMVNADVPLQHPVSFSSFEGPVSSTTHLDLIVQRIAELNAAKAQIDTVIQSMQALYNQRKDAIARREAEAYVAYTVFPRAPQFYPPATLSATPTNTPLVHSEPHPDRSNYPSNFASAMGPHSLGPPFSPSLGSLSTALLPLAPPIFTVYDRKGVKVFRCECGHETTRRGDMTRHLQSVKHAEKSHFCPCGRRYTRKDALLRHQLDKGHV